MRTKIEKLKDEVFLEIKKRCEEFKAESYEHTMKFSDELINFLRDTNLICEADLYTIYYHKLDLKYASLREDDLEALSWHINNFPYYFTDYIKWKK